MTRRQSSVDSKDKFDVGRYEVLTLEASSPASSQSVSCTLDAFSNIGDFLIKKLIESFDTDSRADGYMTATEQCVHDVP